MCLREFIGSIPPRIYILLSTRGGPSPPSASEPASVTSIRHASNVQAAIDEQRGRYARYQPAKDLILDWVVQQRRILYVVVNAAANGSETKV
jgi:hypothetical protein